MIQNFSKTYKSKLSRYFQEITYKRGQYIYKEGDTPEDIYFLLEGEIELSKNFKILYTPNNIFVSYEHFMK